MLEFLSFNIPPSFTTSYTSILIDGIHTRRLYHDLGWILRGYACTIEIIEGISYEQIESADARS